MRACPHQTHPPTTPKQGDGAEFQKTSFSFIDLLITGTETQDSRHQTLFLSAPERCQYQYK